MKSLLQQQELLRKLSRGGGRDPIAYTTPRGVQIAIAHFRARQGALYQQGKDPLAELDAGKRNRLNR